MWSYAGVPWLTEGDPSTLFTSSGMQPVPPSWFSHPSGSRLVILRNHFARRILRKLAIIDTPLFEMLGNWSLGDYFKGQLPWFFEFLTDVVGLDPQKAVRII